MDENRQEGRKEGMKTYVVENKLDTQVPTQDKWPVNFNLLLSLRVGHKVRLSRLCLWPTLGKVIQMSGTSYIHAYC